MPGLEEPANLNSAARPAPGHTTITPARRCRHPVASSTVRRVGGERVGALLLDLDWLAQRRRIRPTDQIPRAIGMQQDSDSDAAVRVRAHRSNAVARRALPGVRDPAVDLVEVVAACGSRWERVRPEDRRHLVRPPHVVGFGARPAALHRRVGRASTRRRSNQAAEHERERGPEHVSMDAKCSAKFGRHHLASAWGGNFLAVTMSPLVRRARATPAQVHPSAKVWPCGWRR
jgi:hypothetical protein